MGHFTAEKRSRFDKTPREWLPVGGQLNDLANGWSSRDDIVTFVGEGAGHGAPACFVPDIAEMEVDVNLAFGEGAKPQFIPDLTVRDNQFDEPVAMGAVLHEAMHAKHSTADLREQVRVIVQQDRDPFAHDVVTSFEETRIEQRGVQRFPENRSFLRACALKLVVGDLKEDEDFAARGHQSMSKLMLLTMARVDAGVLEPTDVTPIAEAAEKLYGRELVGKLRDLWLRAQAHSADHEWRPLYELAKQWIKLLEDAGHEPRTENQVPEWLKEMLQGMVGMPSPGGEGEGEEGEGGMPGILVVMAEEAETEAREEGAAQDAAETAEEIAKGKQAEAQEKQGHEKEAADVFGRGTGPAPAHTNSRLQEKREPNGKERAAAVRLAKDLERARYRDRVVERRRTATPPGKLKMRSAMAGSVQLARGQAWDQEPWDSKRRHHVEDPELKVAVMVDISGSMRRAMEPMAATAWILSEAVKRVQGKAAMMYFGNDVFPVLAPGQHLDKVNVYTAADGTERFDRGFKALNGKMDLLGSNGARLLVVVSDLYHTPQERAAETKWFERCKRAGVAVVVVAPDERMNQHASEAVGQNGTVITLDLTDTAATARAIGAAAVKELQRASR